MVRVMAKLDNIALMASVRDTLCDLAGWEFSWEWAGFTSFA